MCGLIFLSPALFADAFSAVALVVSRFDGEVRVLFHDAAFKSVSSSRSSVWTEGRAWSEEDVLVSDLDSENKTVRVNESVDCFRNGVDVQADRCTHS